MHSDTSLVHSPIGIARPCVEHKVGDVMTHLPNLPIQMERTAQTLRFTMRFVAPMDASTAQERLRDYFTRIGYRWDAQAGVMRRGDWLSAAFRWQPRAFPATVETRLHTVNNQTEVLITVTINRTGQILVGAELETFEAELREAARYLTEGQADFALLEKLNKQVHDRVNLAIALGIAVSIPIIVLMFLFVRPLLGELGIRGTTRAITMGLLTGTVTGLAVWLFARGLLRSARP
ncbi:MAG: hypothetical protein NZM28_00855 [Fimbriimonadales bacterium]|nr:hypothetical protein [Fimbriimonadales bacterium]